MNLLKQLTNPKYRLFTRKIKDVQVAIWELDFKISKARHLREDVRQDRDRAVESALHMDEQMKNTKVQSELDALTAQKADLEDKAKRYEAQMKMIDDEINGIPAQGENPGQNGIMEALAGYAELKELFKDYRSKI